MSFNTNNSLYGDISSHADIVKVISAFIKVIPAGKDFVAVCPFHDDHSPSMRISPSKQMYKCFSCGAGGDAITFVKNYLHISKFEAMKKVAELSGFIDPRLEQKVFVKKVDDKKQPLYKCLKDLTNYYQYSLTTDEAKNAIDYLNGRELDEKIREKYMIGYAPLNGENTIKFLQAKGHSLETIETLQISFVTNDGKYKDKNYGRIVFPLCDSEGNVIGYSARTIDPNEKMSKYINTGETPLFHKSNVLYNYHIAKERASIEQFVYILEGFMDVIALNRIGINSSVALMGTALTEEHIKMIRNLGVEVRMCLDGDGPGQEFTLKNSKILEKSGINVRIVNCEGNTKDPDEIIRSDGPEVLKTYLNNLISRVDFALNYFTKNNSIKTNEQKKLLIQQFVPILIKMNDALEFDNYIRKLSRITGYDVESIAKVINEAKRGNVKSEKILIDDYSPQRKLMKKLQLAEREMLYQMTNSKDAVIFYEENIESFYTDSYRKLADIIIEYMSTHEDINPNSLIGEINDSEFDDKEMLANEIVDIAFDKNHLPIGNELIYKDLLNTINNEKEKISNKDQVDQMMDGKDPREQARILDEYSKKLKHKN